MEYEQNTNDDISQTLEIVYLQKPSKTSSYEKNFSKRWKQPSKTKMVETIENSCQSIQMLNERMW